MKTEQISVPHFEGFKCIGFKIPKVDEYFLLEGELCAAKGYFSYEEIVYEKLPPKRYVFEETGEIRPVLTGEWYLFCDAHPSCWLARYPSLHEVKILRKIDE